MSLKVEGGSCVRCRSYLFSEDDVVYCPVCGAPHHRTCYNALGHCALEELHGTENEYKPQFVEEEKQEPKTDDRKENFMEFDLLGGVPAGLDLGEGVTADEAKKFVGANSFRYIPKFARLNKKRKASWNWLGFLFPSAWMLSRKMYKNGAITALFSVLAVCLSYPLNLKLYNMGISQATAEAMTQITERLPEIGAGAIILSFLGSIFTLGIRIFTGLLGDYIYKNHTLKGVKKIKKECQDTETDYLKKGGVNLLLFLLGVMIERYGILILAIFI